MANIKSMKKDIKRNAKKRLMNQSTKSALKTNVKKARKSGEAGDALVAACSSLDKAAERGIIHRKQASRRKSRLMKAVNKVTAAAATTEQ